MSKTSIERKLEETYHHILPYICPEETPELLEMCKRCEHFCGEGHNFTECRYKPCFKNWLGYEYICWEDCEENFQ